MERHNFDGSVYDYTWKQNRLAKDKDILKKQLMNLIAKKPKKKDNDGNKDEVSQFSAPTGSILRF